MAKVAITGAPQTGKSILSLAVSYMTGIPVIQNRTYLEFANDFDITKKVGEFYWNELLALCTSFFIEGIEQESKINSGFISDGSVFKELIYAKSRILYSKDMDICEYNKFSLLTKNKNTVREYKKMFDCIEKLMKEYLINHYDFIIHIGINEFNSNKNKAEYIKFCKIYDSQLKELYLELGFKFKIYDSLTLEQTLDDIFFDSGMPPLCTSENALFKARKQLLFDTSPNDNINNISISYLEKLN